MDGREQKGESRLEKERRGERKNEKERMREVKGEREQKNIKNSKHTADGPGSSP